MIDQHVYLPPRNTDSFDAVVGKKISRWREHFDGTIELDFTDGTHLEIGAVKTLDPIDGIPETDATLIYVIRQSGHTPKARKTRANPPGLFTK